MFRFIKTLFVVAMPFWVCNALKFFSINNQECKVRPEIVNINSNESSLQANAVAVVIISVIHMQNYAFLMLLNTWILNLISGTNETRYINL